MHDVVSSTPVAELALRPEKTEMLCCAGPVQHVAWLGTDALLVAHSASSGGGLEGMTESGEWLQEIHDDGSGTFPPDRLIMHRPVFLL